MALLVPDDAVVSFAGVQRVLVVQDGKAGSSGSHRAREENKSRSSRGCAAATSSYAHLVI